MKYIGASIVVLASAIAITGGAFVPHSDTRLFVMIVGCVFGLTGLGGWFAAVKEK